MCAQKPVIQVVSFVLHWHTEDLCIVITMMANPTNYHVVLASRPGANGEPQPSNFMYCECSSPAAALPPRHVLIKNCFLSMDPALRCQMNEDTGVHYIQPWQIGETIMGLSGVGVVVESTHPDYQPGDQVRGSFGWPWKLYFIQDVDKVVESFTKVDKSIAKPSLVLSVLGIAGLTSLIGIRQKGGVKPGAGQTCVISGAAGACGSLAGQIARLDGCAQVVGICGSEEKCNWITSDLQFDHAINYKIDNVEQKLQEVCPNGVDIYFDNVGGEISNTVLKQMKPNSSVVLCGQIAVYNKDVPYPPPLPQDIQEIVTDKNIARDRFLVLNYPDQFAPALKQLAEWYFTGKIKVRETVAEGLENAGEAFVSMMKGGNIGKQIVHISNP